DRYQDVAVEIPTRPLTREVSARTEFGHRASTPACSIHRPGSPDYRKWLQTIASARSLTPGARNRQGARCKYPTSHAPDRSCSDSPGTESTFRPATSSCRSKDDPGVR